LLLRIREAIRAADDEKVRTLTEQALRQGVDPLKIINDAVSAELMDIGREFGSGNLFLTDLVAAGNVAEAAMTALRPSLKRETLGTMVLGTVEGDIHDIGKNIVGAVSRASGLEVVDVGKDVSAGIFVQKIKEHEARLVGASALLTTTISKQRDLVDALKETGLRDKVKIIIGGAACSQQWADKIDADAYGVDAMDAVVKAKKLCK
jgi:corrinoid protein of di/trimethylamine methyltransferase